MKNRCAVTKRCILRPLGGPAPLLRTPVALSEADLKREIEWLRERGLLPGTVS